MNYKHKAYFAGLLGAAALFYDGEAGRAASAAQLEAQLDGVVEAVDFESPEITVASHDTLVWQTEIRHIGALYLRLEITAVSGVAGTKVVLSLRDGSGRLVRQYSGAELLERGTFWSAAIPGDHALVSLTAPEPPVGFKLSIKHVAYQAYGGAPLSTVGQDEKEPIANYADDPIVSKVERPVARLLLMENGSSRTCTGFLIETGELMTNYHCVHSQEVCETALAIFGYEHDKTGLLHFGEQFECAKLVEGKVNEALDYAVLALRGDPAAVWGKLALKHDDPATESEIFIVQHPAGEPKKISKKNCRAGLVPVDGLGPETDFAHTCDTAGGSSGSPIFNAAGEIVGLHHYGFGEGGDWTENRAIRMKRILDELDN